MKSQISLWAVCLLVASVFILPQAAQAQCTVASLSGTFQFNFGFSTPPGVFGPPVGLAVGTFVADGAGNLTSTTVSVYEFGLGLLTLPLQPPFPPGFGPPPIGYTVDRNMPSQGSYTVNSDCTGSFTFHYNPPYPVHFDFVMVNGQTGLYFVAADQGDLFAGGAQKI
jgi:hypothetical protein